MIIGVLQFELIIRGSDSLKDKRRIVKSLKDRLHRRFMVSVAEIGALEHHRIALLGLVLVTNSVSRANSVLDRVLDMVRSAHDAELGEVARELLTGEDVARQAEQSSKIDTQT